ncbi:MAG: hypothetical protein KatS3mg076_2317 [Candidatus Binatia bacterium]|nr:MAG: hypothetical protein KatS3mg076_2317 [Candidatus Binatia bacterium]
MRWVPAVALCVGLAVFAANAFAQPTPGGGFSVFRCRCAVPLRPSEPLGARGVQRAPAVPWTGTVYARRAEDASWKARQACLSERGGRVAECELCGCQR